jgi:hypothetical protein
MSASATWATVADWVAVISFPYAFQIYFRSVVFGMRTEDAPRRWPPHPRTEAHHFVTGRTLVSPCPMNKTVASSKTRYGDYCIC